MLDIDHGTYPFVSSSSTVSGGVCTGLGVAPNAIGEIFGIFKAYSTRVGSGPFPVELFDETGDRIREIGHEYGAVTGRNRRCGWVDLVALKYAIMINGVTQLITIYIDSIVSEEKPVGGGKIFWGLTISFHGKNLLPIVEGDSVEWSFTDATGEAHSGTCGAPFIPHPMFVMGNRTTVSWAHWPEDMPRSAIGRKVTFTYCSRAGDPAAEMQRHSISATVMDYQGLPRT